MLVTGVGHPTPPEIAPGRPDIRAMSWIVREAGSGTRAVLEDLARDEGLTLDDLRVFLVLPGNEAVREAVEAGAGATIISEHVVASAIEAGRLRAVPIKLPPREFALVRHRERHVSIALDALVRHLAAEPARGGFEQAVAAALAAAGLPVVVVNPRQVRDFARALGQLAKTDAIDAKVIALFAERVAPPIRPLKDAETRLLDELVTRRRQLIEMIVAEGNRARQLTSAPLKSRIERHRAALQKELSEIERELDHTIRSTPIWCETHALLTSVPGVGDTLARTIIAELPELGTLDRRKAAALRQGRATLSPLAGESGPARQRGVE